MKTTIEIPESLYKKAKIHAVEQGTTLKALVLNALRRELNSSDHSRDDDDGVVYWAERKLLPEYRALIESGALRGGMDSTTAISEERDAR